MLQPSLKTTPLHAQLSSQTPLQYSLTPFLSSTLHTLSSFPLILSHTSCPVPLLSPPTTAPPCARQHVGEESYLVLAQVGRQPANEHLVRSVRHNGGHHSGDVLLRTIWEEAMPVQVVFTDCSCNALVLIEHAPLYPTLGRKGMETFAIGTYCILK